MRKYTSDPRAATGRYTSRAAEMEASVDRAWRTLSSMSSAVRLVSSRFSIRAMSSRISPFGVKWSGKWWGCGQGAAEAHLGAHQSIGQCSQAS
jgi:hypothetical protein